MRMAAAMLCIGLLIKDRWSDRLKPYVPLYWYLTVLYCLPFFCSYMFLLNHGSAAWLVNVVMASFLLIMIVDWLSFFCLMALGILLGIIWYKLTIGAINIESENVISTVVNIIWVVLVCLFFSYSRDAQVQEKAKYITQMNELNNSLEQRVRLRTTELEKALVAKTEFLSNMSHEIRTPIQGFTNISAGLVEHWDEFDNSKRRQLATEIASNSARLALLVRNLLDMSKFSAGKMQLELRQFDLNEVIQEIIEECQTLYLSGKQLEIKFDRSASAWIVADSERIAQVLRNLFINAIKFSPDKGSITIRLSQSTIVHDNSSCEKALHFSIADQGIGIPQQELDSIFLPFTQSSRTKTKAGGTGLSLSIAREIIAAHHGKIWAKNNHPAGALFEFLLPIKGAQPGGQQHITDSQFQLPAVILIIDDEEACLTSMELLLYNSNYQLIKAASGHMALDYLRSNPDSIDLILLDLMMPEMNGLEVLQILKQDLALCNIPVILQSGTSDNIEVEQARQMGIVSYIKKPYQKQTLLSEISKCLW